MKKRRTNKKFTNLGDVIDKVLTQYRPAEDQSLLRVWDHWDETVGPDVAANARPAAFKSDVLLVHVSNSAWLHHLRFMESSLIANLNRALGAKRIKKMHFKIGPV